MPSVFVIALTLIMLLGIFLYQRSYTGRIYRGVNVLGWDVSGMTPAEAEAHLHDRIRYYEDAQLIFRDGNELWIATPQDLGANLETHAVVAEAYAVGRTSDLRGNLWQQVNVYQNGYIVVPRTVFDPVQARAYVQRMAEEINLPARDADVTLNDLTAEVTPSRVGRHLDVEPVVSAIQQRILHQSQEPIDLGVQVVQPAIADAPAIAAKERIDRLLSAPIVVRYGDRSWTISREMLRDWLVLDKSTAGGELKVELYIDPAKVRGWVEPLAAEVYQLPEDARLDFDPDPSTGLRTGPSTGSGQRTGQIHVIHMSREGRALDIGATVDRIVSATESSERTVPLTVITEKPAVDARDVLDMGIVELVSRATTYFKGSPAGRIKNIQISASKFNGVVVPPGEAFSFNRYLGDVSQEEGYEEAYIITGDRTTVGIGGGVCQVSTTAFRAAFFGGFPIVERWAHGYRVGWYETSSIPGLDATIYSPSVDFKFRNDTGAYLLIETEVDARAGTLTFYFYGTRPAREVDIEGPEISNVTPPKDPVYRVDEDLPPGTIKQIDWANEGSDVVVYRIIKKDGNVVSRERFESHYQPWADVYLVGPDTNVPDQD
ncbi:MAG: VanW family protein [Anaerolineae bacterium]